jgi:hypothetical protein
MCAAAAAFTFSVPVLTLLGLQCLHWTGEGESGGGAFAEAVGSSVVGTDRAVVAFQEGATAEAEEEG